MVCVHLRELYQLCESNQLKLSGSDLIRVVCTQCDLEDTCPSVLVEQYEARHPDNPDAQPQDSATDKAD